MADTPLDLSESAHSGTHSATVEGTPSALPYPPISQVLNAVVNVEDEEMDISQSSMEPELPPRPLPSVPSVIQAHLDENARSCPALPSLPDSSNPHFEIPQRPMISVNVPSRPIPTCEQPPNVDAEISQKDRMPLGFEHQFERFLQQNAGRGQATPDSDMSRTTPTTIGSVEDRIMDSNSMSLQGVEGMTPSEVSLNIKAPFHGLGVLENEAKDEQCNFAVGAGASTLDESKSPTVVTENGGLGGGNELKEEEITEETVQKDVGGLDLTKGDAPSAEGSEVPKTETESQPTGDETIKNPEETESQGYPADKVYEYQWPQDKTGDHFVLQEQVSEFLSVLSFKRKYPDLQRRPVEFNERIFLREKGYVTEHQCDLGLTALRSDEVYDLMAKDYPVKYKDMLVVIQAREHQKIKEQQKSFSLANLEKSKMEMYLKRAVRSAAEFNAQFMREKREERRAYFDLQTQEVHYPKSKFKVLPKESTKVDAYPVALFPGQFQDYYKRYSPQELNYFPLNTAMYSPPKPLKSIYVDPQIEVDAEEEAEKVKASATAAAAAAAAAAESSSSESSSDDESGSASSSASGSESSEEEEEGESEPEVVVTTPAPRGRGRGRGRGSGRGRGRGKRIAVANTDAATPGRKGKKLPATPKSAAKTPGRRPRGVAATSCNVCNSGSAKNSLGQPEELVTCAECNGHSHPSCLDLPTDMLAVIKTYDWQCMDCKTCVKCKDPHDEEKMMFCDHCDRGYHTFCVGMRTIPPGSWECPSCRPETPAKKRRRKLKEEES